MCTEGRRLRFTMAKITLRFWPGSLGGGFGMDLGGLGVDLGGFGLDFGWILD